MKPAPRRLSRLMAERRQLPKPGARQANPPKPFTRRTPSAPVQPASPLFNAVIRHKPSWGLVLATVVVFCGTLAFVVPWPLNQEARYASVWSELDERIRAETAMSSEPFANIVLDVAAVDPGERKLDVNVIARFYGHDFYRQLVDGQGKQVALPAKPVTETDYPRMQLTILPGFFAEPVYVYIPISKMSSETEVQGSIKLDARPQAFPNDIYDLSAASATLELPAGVFYKTGDGTARLVSYLSFGIALSQGDRLVDWTVRPGYAISRTDKYFPQIADLGGSVRRPLDYTFSVYSVAAAPLLLGLAAAVESRRRFRETSRAAPSLELAASLLALLTLRQVLVPTDIPGITWLDRLLAIEVVAIVALIVLPIALPVRSPSSARS